MRRALPPLALLLLVRAASFVEPAEVPTQSLRSGERTVVIADFVACKHLKTLQELDSDPNFMSRPTKSGLPYYDELLNTECFQPLNRRRVIVTGRTSGYISTDRYQGPQYFELRDGNQFLWTRAHPPELQALPGH